MTEDQARALVAAVARAGLSEPRVSALERVWEALASLDAAAIEARAALWLAELEPAELAAEFPDPEERRERAAMRAFYATVLDYWIDQSPEVYPAVEHDIDNWLEGHAQALARVRWDQLDALLTEANDQAGRRVLQSWLNVAQQAARLDVEQRTLWALLEARVVAALELFDAG
jgi:hypothetical protein